MSMSAKDIKVWAVTGNDLLSGRVVYLSHTGGYVDNLTSARMFSTLQTAQACLELALTFSRNVNDLHVMMLTRSGDKAIACAMREHIRQYGPTNGHKTESQERDDV